MAKEKCGHVPARPDVNLTLCWKCGVEIVADIETHLWRPLTVNEKLVRRETIRELQRLFTSISSAEFGRVLYEKLATRNAPSIRVAESIMGRWIIVNGQQEDLAWSGSRWVPHCNGIPMGDAQVCNFTTRDEAKAYAKEQFPEG